jgi:hypothetical protein
MILCLRSQLYQISVSIMTDQFTESIAPYTSGTPLLTLNDDVGDEGPPMKKQKLNPS